MMGLLFISYTRLDTPFKQLVQNRLEGILLVMDVSQST